MFLSATDLKGSAARAPNKVFALKLIDGLEMYLQQYEEIYMSIVSMVHFNVFVLKKNVSL